jgi:hypothetical protein
MTFKHIFGIIRAVAAVPLAISPAFAQAAPAAAAGTATQVAAGATVYGPDGTEAGKIDKIEGGNAIVNTGKHTAGVPVSAIGRSAKGLTISMNRDQIDAAVEAADAKATGNLASALVAGAAIKTSDGQPFGKVSAVSPEGVVTIEREGAPSIGLQKDQFTTNADGLALRMTAAQLNAAIAKQSQASASTPPAQP